MTAPIDAPITEQEVEAMAQRIAQWADFNRAEAAALLRRLWAECERLKECFSAREMRGMVDRAERAEAEVALLRGLLRSLSEWDMMDSAADSPYWRKQIDAALKEPK